MTTWLDKKKRNKVLSDICITCNKNFTYNSCNSRKPKNCTKKCAAIYREQKGCNHKSWNKGLTKETSPLLVQIAQTISKVEKGNHPSKFKGLTKKDLPFMVVGAERLKQAHAEGRFKEAYRKSKETIQRLYREGKLKNRNTKGYGKGGFREDLGHYVRSMFEANYCRYLKYYFLGYKYEPKTFVLQLPNGNTCTYTPDFQLCEPNFIELKGYKEMNNLWKSELFKQQYPDLHLKVIFQNSQEWKDIEKNHKNTILNWERYGNLS